MEYLISGAAYLSQAIIIAAIITAIIYIVRRQKINPYKVATYYAFSTYVVVVGLVTGLLQQPWDFSTQISYNYLPFCDLDMAQMMMNCLLFVPMGFMMPMLSRKISTCFRAGSITFGASIGIEVIQMFFLGRYADINDVIANGLGGIIGFGLYVFFQRTVLNKRERHDGIGTLSMYFGLIGLFLGLAKNGISIGDVILYNWGIDTLSSPIYTTCVMLFFGMAGLLAGWKYRDDILARGGEIVSVLVIFFAMMKIIF